VCCIAISRPAGCQDCAAVTLLEFPVPSIQARTSNTRNALMDWSKQARARTCSSRLWRAQSFFRRAACMGAHSTPRPPRIVVSMTESKIGMRRGRFRHQFADGGRPEAAECRQSTP
jgi:hypothetical protein